MALYVIASITLARQTVRAEAADVLGRAGEAGRLGKPAHVDA